MIFGKTTSQKATKEQERLSEINKNPYKRVYAFFPTELNNGQYAWFEYIFLYISITECRTTGRLNRFKDGDCYLSEIPSKK